MPDIDLKGCTPEFILEQAIKLYGDKWLHVLSKVSYFSRQHIIDTLNEHLANRDPLKFEFLEPLQKAFLEKNADYINSVILSRFEVLQITNSINENKIEFIKIIMDGSVIHLDFFDQMKIPSKTDCIKTMQSDNAGIFKLSNYSTAKEDFKCAERWLSVIETLESEELKFVRILQEQINYLSEAKCYKAPNSFGVNIPRLTQLYTKKNKNQRYIRGTASVEFEKEMMFLVDDADLIKKVRQLEAESQQR